MSETTIADMLTWGEFEELMHNAPREHLYSMIWSREQKISSLQAECADAEQRLAAAGQQHSDVRAALLAYTRAHGNVAQLSNDMVEVEMFKCFLRAVSVLGIVAKPPTPPATATREQRKRTLDDVDRAIQQDGEYT